MMTKHRTRLNGGGRAAGFSLIELLLAAAVGLIVIFGVVGLYVSHIKTFQAEDMKRDLQQKSRFAENKIGKDFRTIGYDGKNGREFGLTDISLDEWGNSTLEFTADIGKPRDGQCNCNNGDLDVNETFKFRLYKSSLTPPAQAGDPNGGNTDLGKKVGIGTNSLMIPGVEAVSFAYAYDVNLDGKLERYNNGVIWAIDTDGDNQLDSAIDSNFDGEVNFADTPVPLANLEQTTNIRISRIRAVKAWILLRSQKKRRELPNHLAEGSKTYYVGHRTLSTGTGEDRLDPYHMRMLLTFTVKLRNMGLQGGG